MDAKEIFSKISAHQIKGMMIHDQLANYYDFLGLEGYKRCHEYHFMQETCAYRGICRYFINHHNMLIPEERIENPDVIPASWFEHIREDVDATTKKNAVKSGLAKWIAWERDTKIFYQQMYHELMELGEIASAFKVKELICDVDNELKKAERYLLNKETTGYDLVQIIDEQKSKHKKYQKKMEHLGVKIC